MVGTVNGYFRYAADPLEVSRTYGKGVMAYGSAFDLHVEEVGVWKEERQHGKNERDIFWL